MTRDSSAYGTDHEKEVVEYLRSQLIGPVGGPTESLVEPPTKRYALGVLFPKGSEALAVNRDEEVGDPSNAPTDDGHGESPINLAFQRLPASMGISFFLKKPTDIRCAVWGAAYGRVEDRTLKGQEGIPSSNSGGESTSAPASKEWRRLVLAEPHEPEVILINPAKPDLKRRPVLGGKAEVDVRVRALSGGALITVSLISTSTTESNYPAADDCLFQVGFKCDVSPGRFEAYPRIDRVTSDDEDDELALMYSNRKVYAIGHGCAAVWPECDDGKGPHWITAEVMPTTKVKAVTTTLDDEHGQGDRDSINHNVFRLQHLMDNSLDVDQLGSDLDVFVSAYERWINGVRSMKIAPASEEARKRIVNRLLEACDRMRRGIATLRDVSRPEILKAFRLANEAMLRQWVHASRQYAGTSRPLGDGVVSHPDYRDAAWAGFAWRPFQLAFQLQVMNSLILDSEEDERERDLVDLIWFPTGGGKTEAYLSIAAFVIILRRLRFGEKGAGTAVLKRYTLRLLTAQQFERAASLIASLELMRREHPVELGTQPIRLGLWVGERESPNRFATDSPNAPGAKELYERLLDEEEPKNPFQLHVCPLCGTRIVPTSKSHPTEYGIEAGPGRFKFYCPDKRCVFHDEIPVSVVDQDLYERPPSLVIGTIDKFAMMAWDERSSAFFGAGDVDLEPPSLIIQDELHLISGPLGTIAGIYESAVDTVISKLGVRPKIIAATATIRRAEEQARRLYAREVRVFPPPGIDADDSFFARVDEDSPGRVYVGVMPQGHTRMFSLVQVAAVLAQAPEALGLRNARRDALWTQVIYHNSKRELGKTMTLARDDIPARIQVIESTEDLRRRIENVVELSSNVKGKGGISRVLEKLKKPAGTSGAVDILPCTNMISVGVDVSRLGLMLVYGQPKSTAEYIQATSRIGRKSDGPPGIVVVLYAPTKPRDRSHYEAFGPYHSSLYRHVEPTSVTPYAPPARDRALHAAMVITMRHAGGLSDNSAAANFNPVDPDTRALLESLINRMIDADVREKEDLLRHFRSLTDEWRELAESASPALRYRVRSRAHNSLLKEFRQGDDNGIWRTLRSMRSVDQESEVAVLWSSR